MKKVKPLTFSLQKEPELDFLRENKIIENIEKKTKNTRRPVVLGPVANPEDHVRKEWWREIFTPLYLKTDGDVINDDDITRHEVDIFLDILKPLPDSAVLDLCCGQGRHTLEFARHGFKFIEGLDRSHYLIQKARAIIKKEGLNVKFREGDARKLPYPADNFDIVMILGNSFGYFETSQDDLRVLKEVFRVLKPRGKILIDVSDGEYLRKKFNPRSWEWVGKKYFVCRERALSVDRTRLISREIITDAEKGVIADQFYAERLYSHQMLKKLLEGAGFYDTFFHSEISVDSKRNQDLGMMEQRLIYTAAVQKEWTPVKKKKTTAASISVILGDPSRPDVIKPSQVFDDDDLYTIDRLKSALNELKKYRFGYLVNHNKLIYDLTKLKGKTDFVFNLCDEGFMNDARKELHIPALLEEIGIPYTGAGPQCLAYCYDKSLVRGIAKEMSIPVPQAFFIKPEDSIYEISISFPVIVKPNLGDSSFGITQKSVANNLDELISAISEMREKFGYDKPILVEEFLTGSDLTVGIIGNPPESYTILPIIEEDYSELPDGLPKICGYEAKWRPDSPYAVLKSVPADIPEETKKSIEEWCVGLFERLECRDYARFDWRLNSEGVPKLLEANPNPGWCWDGHLAKMANLAGMSYNNMLETILLAAQKRISGEK
ncbi:MAG: methyltransferase domain-containing protein [bacterium]